MKSDTRPSALTGMYLSLTAHSFRKVTTLAELIRLSGAALIVFALSLFLMQGVDATNDLQRYHLLLLQTSLLGVAGFAVGYLLKEPRGARVFFSLGLISVPANLAVLGAMVYSIMPSSSVSAHYPEYANWQASNLSQITLAMLTGLIAIVPMSLFAFSVLARQSRTWLTCGYLLACSMLLLPIRGSISITVLSGVVALCMVALIRNRQSARISVLTVEERFAHILLFLPSVLMLARSAVLYSSDFQFTLVAVIAAYFLLRQCSGHCSKVSFWSHTLHVITTLTAVCLSALLSNLSTTHALFPGADLVFVLILGGLLLDLSRRVASRSLRWWMHTGWALLSVSAFLGTTLFGAGSGAFIYSLLVSILMIGSGFALKNRLVTFLGVISITGSVLVQGNQVIRLLLDSSWVAIAMVGAAVVISGSLIERYGVTVKLKIQAIAGQYQVRGCETDSQIDIDGPDTDLPNDSELPIDFDNSLAA